MERVLHNERFRDLVAQIRDYAIYMVDAEGKALSWNEGVRSVLGYEEPEFLGLDAALLFTPDDRAAGVPERELAAAAERGSASNDRWMLRKDGTRFWASGRTSPVRDTDGRLRGFAKVMRDRTELREALESSRRSEEQLRLITDLAPSSIAYCDSARRYRFVNAAYAARFGLTPEDVVGREICEVLGDAAYETIRPWVEETLAGKRLEFEVVVPYERLGERVMHCTYAPETAPDGSVRAFVAVVTDVTSWRRAEAELHASEARFRALSESGVISVAFFEESGAITDANDQFLEMIGYTRDELREGLVRWDMLTPPDWMPRTRQGIEELRTTGRISPYEKEYFRRDGTRFWGLFGGVRLNGSQGVAFTLDITERKRAEEQLRQAQRMEAVGRLAGGIAHDLNNMLMAILGYTGMLARSLGNDDPRRDDLNQVRLAADRSATLTRQLLAFARRDMIQPVTLDVNTVLLESERLIRPLLGEQIELVLDLSPTAGSVSADRAQLEQVLLNLALNARDAMPQGGRLTLASSDLVVDDAYARRHPGIEIPRGHYTRVLISDTGHGMDDETRARAFEPFFTTKPVGRGTGLGLSMVYGAVKQGGGFVWVTSAPGQGTSFDIILPQVAAVDDPRPAESPAPAPIRGRSETILVVEDERMVRELMARGLREAGYRSIEASDGEQALKLVQDSTEPIHLVVSDVVMPGLSGRELGNRLAALRPGVPILYMSAYSSDEVVHRGLLAERDLFVAKPVTPDALVRRVREILG